MSWFKWATRLGGFINGFTQNGARTAEAEAEQEAWKTQGKAIEVIAQGQSRPGQSVTVVNPRDVFVSDPRPVGRVYAPHGVFESELHSQDASGTTDRWQRTEVSQQGGELHIKGEETTISHTQGGQRTHKAVHYEVVVPDGHEMSPAFQSLLPSFSPPAAPAIEPPKPYVEGEFTSTDDSNDSVGR